MKWNRLPPSGDFESGARAICRERGAERRWTAEAAAVLWHSARTQEAKLRIRGGGRCVVTGSGYLHVRLDRLQSETRSERQSCDWSLLYVHFLGGEMSYWKNINGNISLRLICQFSGTCLTSLRTWLRTLANMFRFPLFCHFMGCSIRRGSRVT